MNATEEYRQQLVTELIGQSAKIDQLVVKSRQPDAATHSDTTQELEALRAKQRETTKKLHELEAAGGNAWENIGGGG